MVRGEVAMRPGDFAEFAALRRGSVRWLGQSAETAPRPRLV